MNRLPSVLALVRVAALVAGCVAGAAPAAAASSAASSASDSVATSVGSISGSIQQSSASSSKTTGVAAGDYKILETAEVAGRPGLLRLTLQPADGRADGGFDLLVPQPVVAQARLAVGATVSARARPYGLEFAQGEPREAFFLVLADAWYRELQTTAVVL